VLPWKNIPPVYSESDAYAQLCIFENQIILVNVNKMSKSLPLNLSKKGPIIVNEIQWRFQVVFCVKGKFHPQSEIARYIDLH